MGGSSSSSPSDYSTEVRYAPYIATAYESLLTTVAGLRAGIIDASPYDIYVDQEVADGFFGAGYAITDFSSLYEMFGNFMSGLDIDFLFTEIFDEQNNLAEVNGEITASSDLLSQDIEQTTIPEFEFSMRDVNATASSTFLVGKTKIELNRLREVYKISTDVKFKLLANTYDKYKDKLNWMKQTVLEYAEVMKLYYLTESQASDADSTFAAKHSLWPFEVTDFERACLGTMRQQADYKKSSLVRKRSTVSKVLLIASYTVNGVMIGAQCGGYVGAIIGGVIGFVVGLAQVLFE